MTIDNFDKYFYKPKNIKELKNTAYVVIDTNVLLSAYQWKEVTLKEVLDVLKDLSSNQRLKIPSHVFKEFVHQRPKKILEIIQNVEKDIHSKLQKPKDLVSIVPFLDMLPEAKEYVALEKEFLQSYDNYRKKTKDLINHIKSFFEDDLVLGAMEDVLRACYFTIEEDEKVIMEAAQARSKEKRPPLTGGDSGKNENVFGDFIIWKHILALNNDVIFVTADGKDDWVLKDHQGNVLSPRRELIEEFYEANSGKTFTIVSPKKFVELFKPEISDDVSIDLTQAEVSRNGFFINWPLRTYEVHDLLFPIFRELFMKYDPIYAYAETEKENVYDYEISRILKSLPLLHSVDDIATEIINLLDYPFNKEEVRKVWRLAKDIWLGSRNIVNTGQATLF